ncbi:MAG: SGNH/GDSL hydrolase family protein, partial [Agrococcus sp.]
WQRVKLDDIAWAREHLAPWVVRRLRGQSSGDTIHAKRPTAGPVLPIEHVED